MLPTRRAFLATTGVPPWLLRLVRAQLTDRPSPFRKENLVAWCIVPFDARKRGPDERAQMLQRLGLKRLAYDFRAEHIPTFDREIDALERYGIELTAFWLPTDLEPERNTLVHIIFDLIERRGVRPQLWVTLSGTETREFLALPEWERLDRAARAIFYLAQRARRLGCKVGLYNHGGWFGEPENQIAIVRRLRLDNIGIVYNFHHGHEHLDRFGELYPRMLPYLIAINLNGMRKQGPQILPLGSGDHELEMLRLILQSGYQGPVGILGHRPELDAEESLRQNLEGLRRLLECLGDQDALATYR